MRTFAGIKVQALASRLIGKPTHVQDTKFGGQSRLPPTTLGITIDWAGTYGASSANPNIGINVSIPVGGPRQTLDTIRSVRIDNTGNPVPVYVQFPDVPYVVVAPPNTVVWEPVETGQFDALVYGIGFTTGQAGVSAVYFCNFAVPPVVNYEIATSVALWKASAQITRGSTIYNQDFGTPALGDQTNSVTLTMQTPGANIAVLGPLASGFFYVTSVVLNANGITDAAGPKTAQVIFESTGISGILYNFETVAFNGITLPTIPVYNQSNKQLKLDATQTWRLRNVTTISNGFWQFFVDFTFNPT